MIHHDSTQSGALNQLEDALLQLLQKARECHWSYEYDKPAGRVLIEFRPREEVHLEDLLGPDTELEEQ